MSTQNTVEDLADVLEENELLRQKLDKANQQIKLLAAVLQIVHEDLSVKNEQLETLYSNLRTNPVWQDCLQTTNEDIIYSRQSNNNNSNNSNTLSTTNVAQTGITNNSNIAAAHNNSHSRLQSHSLSNDNITNNDSGGNGNINNDNNNGNSASHGSRNNHTHRVQMHSRSLSPNNRITNHLQNLQLSANTSNSLNNQKKKRKNQLFIAPDSLQPVNTNTQCYINDIAVELQFKICQYLTFDDLVDMTLLSKFWNNIVNNDIVWRTAFKIKWNCNDMNDISSETLNDKLLKTVTKEDIELIDHSDFSDSELDTQKHFKNVKKNENDDDDDGDNVLFPDLRPVSRMPRTLSSGDLDRPDLQLSLSPDIGNKKNTTDQHNIQTQTQTQSSAANMIENPESTHHMNHNNNNNTRRSSSTSPKYGKHCVVSLSQRRKNNNKEMTISNENDNNNGNDVNDVNDVNDENNNPKGKRKHKHRHRHHHKHHRHHQQHRHKDKVKNVSNKEETEKKDENTSDEKKEDCNNVNDVCKKSWKEQFCERLKVERCWRQGKAKVMTLAGHNGSITDLKFDEYRLITASDDGSLILWQLNNMKKYKPINFHANNNHGSRNNNRYNGNNNNDDGYHSDSSCSYSYSYSHSNTNDANTYKSKRNNNNNNNNNDSDNNNNNNNNNHGRGNALTRKLGGFNNLSINHIDYNNPLKKMTLSNNNSTNSNNNGDFSRALSSVARRRWGVAFRSSLGLKNNPILNSSNSSGMLQSSHNINNNINNNSNLINTQNTNIINPNLNNNSNNNNFNSNNNISMPYTSSSMFQLTQQHHKQNDLNFKRIEFNGHGGPVWSLDFDNQLLISGSYDKCIKIWNILNGICYLTLRGHQEWVSCVKISEKTRLDYNNNNDSKNVNDDINNNNMNNDENYINFNKKRILSGSWDATIRLWELNNIDDSSIHNNIHNNNRRIKGKCILQLNQENTGNAIHCLQWSNDESFIVCGTRHKCLQIWDLEYKTVIRTFIGHLKQVYCLKMNKNIIVSGSADRSIKLWDPRSAACIQTLNDHNGPIMSLQFDNHKIVSAGYDKIVKIFDLRNYKCLHSLSGHSKVVFALQYDKEKIITGSADKRVLVWNFQ